MGKDDNVKTEFVVRSDDGRALHAIRSALATLLREIGAPDSEVFAAEIVIGELLTNTHRYTRGDVRISLELDSNNASLLVCDRGTGPRLPATLPDDQAESGRGLYIVQSLADTLEATQRDGWTEIRADLRVHRSARKSA
jgi:anti-sigma regulatory factor (Ser/Thr protein kinase)